MAPNKKSLSLLEKLVEFAVSNRKRYVKWLTITKLQAIAHLPTKENLISLVWKNCALTFLLMIKSKLFKKRILSIPEFHQKNKWTTLLDKLNSYKTSMNNNTLHIPLFLTLAQELISKDKVWQPFWTTAYRELSETLLSPTEIDYVDLDSNLSNNSLKRVEGLSQSLMTKITRVPNRNSQKTYFQLSTSTVVDKWEREAIEDEQNLKAVKILLKTKKNNKIPFNIVNEWINTSNYVYNKTVEYINKGEKIHFQSLRDKLVTSNTKKNNHEYQKLTEQIKNMKKEKKMEEVIELKNKLSTLCKVLIAEKNTEVKDWELQTPKEIRAGAVNDVCKAYKTGFENLKRGNIRFFKLGFRKHYNKSKSIVIQKNLIKVKNGQVIIAPTFTKNKCIFEMGKKSMKKYKDIEINNDVRLVKDQNKYYLVIPVENQIKPKENLINYCGIDPGTKTFLTLFGNNGVVEYQQNPNLLARLNKKIDLLKKGRVEKKSRIGYRKRSILKVERRKENVVNELHWKVINDILKENDVVFYGDIKSHNIVKGNKNHRLNREFNDMKFYKFKLRFLYKSKIKSKLLFEVPENHTTKTCSNCGSMYEVGLSRVFKCTDCGLVGGRDINASKNILMKGIINNL